MALKSTIFKAELAISDVDRQLYVDHALTIARHPSENDERMMMRILAFALHVPKDDDAGKLELCKGISDPDEPDLWRKNLTGELEHWIEIGEPEDRRLVRAAGRSRRVTVLGHRPGFGPWWEATAPKVARLSNLDVWRIETAQVRALAELTQRTMRLQLTIQDGLVWVSDETHNLEITPVLLTAQ